MNVLSTENIIAVLLILAGVATLFLIPGSKHRFSFVSLILIGCVHLVFNTILILERYIEVPTPRLFGNDSTYILSMIGFIISTAFVFADVILECTTRRICFAVFVAFSLILIIFSRKVWTIYMLTKNPDFDLNDQKCISTTSELRLWKLTILFCRNTVKSNLIGPLLEYLLIYIPMSLMFYMKLNRNSITLKDWWRFPSMEKCQGCKWIVSFGHYIIMFFFVVIWLIRPLTFIIDRFPVRNTDMMPIISMFIIYISMVYYIIQFNGHGKGCINKECLNIDRTVENKTVV